MGKMNPDKEFHPRYPCAGQIMIVLVAGSIAVGHALVDSHGDSLAPKSATNSFIDVTRGSADKRVQGSWTSHHVQLSRVVSSKMTQ